MHDFGPVSSLLLYIFFKMSIVKMFISISCKKVDEFYCHKLHIDANNFFLKLFILTYKI